MNDRVERLMTRARSLRNGKVDPEAVEEQLEVGSPELRERRDRLAERFAELQWDLGGLAYERAARDHFRLDVLVRMAARLQEVDAELAEVERLLRLDEAGAAGSCSSCGALYARGAVFCWQCGADLIARTAVRLDSGQ